MTNENLKAIADHYGLEHQSRKCVEELADKTLDKALSSVS